MIVLSCVADVAAKVDLLERGAQDYLTKPFSLAELLARVRVRLRGEPHHVEAHVDGGARHADLAPAHAAAGRAAVRRPRGRRGRQAPAASPSTSESSSRTSGRGQYR